KRKHNIINSLYLNPDELEKVNFERYKRYEEIEKNEVRYESYLTEDADVCVVAFGIAARVAKNAINEARKEGIRVGLIRPITLWPFPSKAIADTVGHVKAYLSVELSMGQMIEDVRLAVECRRPVYLCNRSGGMIPTPDQVLESIRNISGGNV
ncbi:MAG: 3-methyl-2-oxobutanoate dehydrogenase subunit beta, partial [Clostridia bacterium]|nr:3-methyl-2-oxobutanoate dehydrogenase subunit beta [Clostridia bacterium]